MPSTKESHLWFIRVTAPHEFIETKLKIMKEWIDIKRMAIGFHIGNKTGKEHIHIALELLKAIQQQSINKRIKTLFGAKGADYSSKIWDGSNKVLSYLYHDEKGKVEYFKMELTPAEMEEVKRTHEVYKEIVSTAKAKASNRIPDRILEEIKEGGKQWSTRMIVKRILEGVAKDEWHPPGINMERLVQEIMIKQDPKSGIAALTDYYMRKFGDFEVTEGDFIVVE